MKEQKRVQMYHPTLWIDANNQDSVFCQSRDLVKEKQCLLVEPVRMNQDIGCYSLTYEYGYVGNSKEKYIKQMIQNIEYPQLQAEQVMYRHPRLSPDNFVLSTRIIENKKTKNFLLTEYNTTSYDCGSILLYPCTVENADGEHIAEIEDQEDEEQYLSRMKEVIDGGEKLLKFIHTGNQGIYSAYIPLELDPVVTRDLFRYFNNPHLPSLLDYAFQPDELNLYIDLDCNT